MLIIGDDSLVQSLAITSGVTGELLRNLAFVGPPGSRFANKMLESKFYIRFSPQEDHSKLGKLVIWIGWLNDFQNKLRRSFTLMCFPVLI